MPWTIYWDNGADACGTWGHMIFDSKSCTIEKAASPNQVFRSSDYFLAPARSTAKKQ